jgi:hypothetical protein
MLPQIRIVLVAQQQARKHLEKIYHLEFAKCEIFFLELLFYFSDKIALVKSAKFSMKKIYLKQIMRL